MCFTSKYLLVSSPSRMASLVWKAEMTPLLTLSAHSSSSSPAHTDDTAPASSANGSDTRSSELADGATPFTLTSLN